MFAHLNDDVLFGEVWNEQTIDIKTKCIWPKGEVELTKAMEEALRAGRAIS